MDSLSRLLEVVPETKSILVPQVLRDALLTLAHQYSGQNGAPMTYSALRREYYWPGMHKDVFKHCKACYECKHQNQGQPDDEFNISPYQSFLWK